MVVKRTSGAGRMGFPMKHAVPEDALARGFAFVQGNGSELMKALAAYAVGVASGDDVLMPLQTYQNDDGGWERFDTDMQGRSPLSRRPGWASNGSCGRGHRIRSHSTAH